MKSKYLLNALWLVILVLAGAPLAVAQTAQVTGRIADSSGAVIQGATVTMTHVAKGIDRETFSNEEGYYTVPLLEPATYRMTVQMPGFKPVTRSGITLQVEQVARIDFTLELGEVHEKMTVTDEAPLLEGETSSVGHVVDNARIVNLPLNQRNPFALAFLVPGVTGSMGFQGSGQGNVILVNGGRGGSTEFLLDGIPAAPPLVNTAQGFAALPSMDAVQEFKVQTNNYSAEHGRSGSGIINLIFKSGTNELHGSVFDFLRNSALDANNFFANKNDIPLASFKRNQFGASLGGPVVLPERLFGPLGYDGRNRTFFFVAYEGLRALSAAQLITTVPTEAMRRGDFSQLRTKTGQPITIYDPITTVSQGTGFVRQAFTDNIIPASVMDPVSTKIAGFYPLPNRPGAAVTGINNFAASGTNITENDTLDVKVDQNLSDRQRFSTRYSRRALALKPPDFFPQEILVADPGLRVTEGSNSFSFDYGLTFSPTHILSVRLGANRILRRLDPRGEDFDPSKELGFPAYIRENAETFMFPNIDPAGYLRIGRSGAQRQRNAFETHSLHVASTKTLTRHQLTFGFEGRLLRVNTNERGRTVGSYSFGRNFTQGPNPLAASATAGDGFASFLLGLGSGTHTKFFKVLSTQNYYWGFYLADNFKVSSKLTLNLGLRYELETPRTERFNRLNFFDPQAPSPLAGPSGIADLKGGYVFVTENDRHQFDTDRNNWAPRVGFAYQAASTTVVRGAYGIFYAPSLQAAGGSVSGPGFRSDTPWLATLDGVTPNHFLRDPFPDGFVPVSGNSLGLLTGVGTSVGGGPLSTTVTPYTLQWNVGIQQELPGGILIETTYVGNRGLQLVDGAVEAGLPLNQLRPEHLALGAQLLQKVPNPFFGLISTGPLAGQTVQRRFLLRPFPQFTGVGARAVSGGTSIYHSFQLKAEKRLSQGLAFLVAYTNAKLIEEGSSINAQGSGRTATRQNIFDRRAERAISPNDISQRLVFSYIYELPFGHGKRVGGDWNGLTDALLGGWQINGITTLQKGLPLSISAPNTCNCFNPALRPNISGSAELSGPVVERLARYFDTSVFSQPAPFSFGNAPRTLPDVRAPGVRNWDFSLFKNFRTQERWSVQFRVEAFNLFNTPQFGFPNVFFGNLGRGFGEITSQANIPRQMQFALKILF
ncbi:MAG: TonB-dependent receptor domain-containing protein [Acidobacteriota bacterium]